MLSTNRFVKRYNYFYIFMVINYTYLVWFVLNIDYTGYGLLAFTLLAILFNFKNLSQLHFSKPIAFWVLWVIYSFSNYLFHSSVSFESIVYIIVKLLVPLIVMTIVCIEYQKNSKDLLRACIISFASFTVLGLVFDINLLYRESGETNLLGNRYANAVCLTIWFLSLFTKKRMLNTPLFLILCFSIFIILAMCGVRKAFIAGGIFFGGWMLSELNLKQSRTWLFIPILAFLLYMGYSNFIKDSLVMTRLDTIEERQKELLPEGAPKILSLVGDRASHYYYGWDMFLRKPIFGMGLEQARLISLNRKNMLISSRLHSEYMVQLVENGICGFGLFFLFNMWIIKRVFKQWRERERLSLCILSGIIGLLFMYLTMWAGDFSPSFILLGVVVGYLKQS